MEQPGKKRKQGVAQARVRQAEADAGNLDAAPPSEVAPAPRSRPWLPWLVLGLILLFEAGVRWRLRDFPLERDEGEYAYNAQLLLQGVPPYRLAYASQKLPGTYLASAVGLALWSELPAGLHLSLAIANAVSTVLLFVLVRRLAGDLGALASAAAFAVLGIGEGVLGFAAHATHFVVLPTLGGLIVLLGALDRERANVRLYAAGALFGLGVIVRQPAAAFAVFGIALVISADRRAERSGVDLARRCAVFALGVITPFAMLCAWLRLAGVFPTFWFWTYTYARQYGSQVGAQIGWYNLVSTFPKVVAPNHLIWLGSLVGLVLIARQRRRPLGFFLGCLAACAAAIAAGFFFREHYFVQVLPLAAALFGIACAGSGSSTRKATLWRSMAALAALAVSIWLQREYLFQTAPADLCKRIFAGNMFTEVEVVGRELRSRCAPNDTIAVLGSEAQLYAYAHRRAATGYIYTYSLMEESPFAAHLQDEMIREIEAARPRFMVVAQLPVSWLIRERSPQRIFQWSEPYLAQHYRLVGVAGLGAAARWDDAARAEPPQGNHVCLAIYERLQ